MSWSEIKLAINSRLGKKNYKTLDNIIKEETYESVYNTMMILDNGANIKVIPRYLKPDIDEDMLETPPFYYNTTIVKTALPWGSQCVPNKCCKGATNLRSFLMPDTVADVQESAFAECTNLKDIKLSSSLKKIKTKAFDGSGLEYIFIPEDVTEIASDAFSNCPNLKIIDVAFESGKVSGAPWGATNAQIWYNQKL